MKSMLVLISTLFFLNVHCQKELKVDNLIINPSKSKLPATNTLVSIKKKADTTGLSTAFFTETYRIDTTSCKQNTIAGVFRSTHSSSTFNRGTTGANMIARYNGTGSGDYLYGSITSARHEGKGDINFIIPDSQRAEIIGNQPGKVNYIRGNSDIIIIDNPNIKVNYAQGMHPTVDLRNGTVKSGQVLYLDVDYNQNGNVKITDDFAYIQSGDDKLPNKKGKFFFIKSKTPLPSTFAGTIETNVPKEKIENASEKVLVSKEWIKSVFQTAVSIPKDSIIQNNWRNLPEYEKLGYYKTGKSVYLQGMLSGGKKNQVIFTLPQKFRPQSKLIRQAFDRNKNIKINIDTNGDITLLDNYEEWINLSGVHFRIDN